MTTTPCEPPAHQSASASIPDQHERGRLAEEKVAAVLEHKGYRVIARNFCVNRLGELDIVARKNNTILIVEVKARSRPDTYGGPQSAISQAKLRRLRNTTAVFLQQRQLLNNDIYFLAGLVTIDNSGYPGNISFEPIEWL